MKKLQQGFTLIQLSILLLAASLVMVTILPSTRATQTANQATVIKMNKILSAMRAYESANASLPCPADASVPISSTYYGVAAANAGTTNNCSGGTPAANYTDPTNKVAIGMVPVRALGLSSDYAQDAFGRDITYAVDTNATVCFKGTLTGQVAVTDNNVLTKSVAALISHGVDGHGAWLPLTGSTGTASRLNAASTDTDQHLVNAHGINGPGFPANYSMISSLVTSAESTTTTYVRKPPTSTFDDLVVYRSNLWNLNAVPASTSSVYPAMTTYPASGSYYTGQPLTFVMTFPQAVTVTGTPEIAITMQSGTEYATYQSGSGTTALTFTYNPIKATDYSYAPTGISVASPITLNGGSIMEGTEPACVNYTQPSLTGVIINPPVYVVDTVNNRVQKLSGSGACLLMLGSGSPDATCSVATPAGAGNGQFNFAQAAMSPGRSPSIIGYVNTGGIAFYASGNMYVTDTGNNRVEIFNNSGAYVSQNGTSGTGSGQFAYPTGIAVDSSGNQYVVDTANNRVQKLSSSGACLLMLGSGSPDATCSVATPAGAGNGQFNFAQAAMSPGRSPSIIGYVNIGGISLDTGGNIYVTDSGNNRVEIFNSSGAYVGQHGTSGSGSGQFAYPTGIAVDSSGNQYVVDSVNNRVQKLSSSGACLLMLGSGSPDATCSVATPAGAGNGQFNFAQAVMSTGRPPTIIGNVNIGGISLDTGGNIYVTDSGNNRVEIFNSSGAYVGQHGTPGSGSGQFDYPNGIAFGR